jgi:hypothetical protein
MVTHRVKTAFGRESVEFYIKLYLLANNIDRFFVAKATRKIST